MPRDRTILRNRKAASEQESSDIVTGFIKLEAVYQAQDLARTELEGVIGKPICVEGCGRCCEGMTPVSSRLEALWTLAHMSFLPSYTDLKARAHRWMTDGTQGLNVEELKKAPCPFLADDKSCSIYEFRPLACRTYGVTSLAKPDCPRPLHYTESADNRMYIDKDTPMGSAIKGLTQHVIGWIQRRNPVMGQVGFFPALIAQETTTKETLAEMPIAPDKMKLRQAVVKGQENE